MRTITLHSHVGTNLTLVTPHTREFSRVQDLRLEDWEAAEA